MPKSATFTRPSLESMMLPGFTSRWTIPRAWAADEGPGDLGGDAGRLARRERPVPAQDRGEILAVDQLHDDERPVLVLAEVVHGHDVGMVQRRRGQRLLPEARAEVGIAAVLGAEDLDRDVAIELGVVGAVDGGHAPLPEELHQPIPPAQDAADLRQIAVSHRVGWPSGARIVAYRPHALAAPARVQTLRDALTVTVGTDRGTSPRGLRPRLGSAYSSRPWRYSRNSRPSSGRASASSTDALSQPMVVPAS